MSTTTTDTNHRKPVETVAWETFWLRLLREYEDVCRELEPDNPRYACGQSGLLRNLDRQRHHPHAEEGEIH